MAARQVSAAECFPRHSVGAGLLTRPPVLGWVSFHAEDFALWGEFLSQRWERNQRIAGGDSHRRREQVPSGSSSFSPGPPFTGDTPIPFRKISGAQNMVPGFGSSRAAGTWCGAKFRPVPFYCRAWFRPAVAEGAGPRPARVLWTMTSVGRDDPARCLKGRTTQR